MKYAITVILIFAIFGFFKALYFIIAGIAYKKRLLPAETIETIDTEHRERIKARSAEKLAEYSKVSAPYYIADQVKALEETIENIYCTIADLEKQRDYTFNQAELMHIDKQTARLKLDAAKKMETLEKLYQKYNMEV